MSEPRARPGPPATPPLSSTPLVVAIDGPSGSGKSSTARGVADGSACPTSTPGRCTAPRPGGPERGTLTWRPRSRRPPLAGAAMDIDHDPRAPHCIDGTDVTAAIRDPRFRGGQLRRDNLGPRRLVARQQARRRRRRHRRRGPRHHHRGRARRARTRAAGRRPGRPGRPAAGRAGQARRRRRGHRPGDPPRPRRLARRPVPRRRRPA